MYTQLYRVELQLSEHLISYSVQKTELCYHHCYQKMHCKLLNSSDVPLRDFNDCLIIANIEIRVVITDPMSVFTKLLHIVCKIAIFKTLIFMKAISSGSANVISYLIC